MRVDEVIEGIHRAERARVLAGLIGVLRDFDLAEESLQDAYIAALEAWPRVGIPENPAGWLMTAARRKAIDRLRRSAALDRRHRQWGELAIAWIAPNPAEPIADDRLRLIFTCCHPSLAVESQVALTLRTLCGLTTAEVAHAFMISEMALGQRLVRAKRKIRDSRIPYRVPLPSEHLERLDAVLAVVALVFNAGYLPVDSDRLVRVDLCDEALRLALLLTELLPEEPEPLALAALLNLHDSRRAARSNPAGRPLTLEEQDRELWDRSQILVGLEFLKRAVCLGRPGPYALKANIAAVHATTRQAVATNWINIVALYDQLLILEPSPIVQLNRSVAVAMAGSPQDGLQLIDDRHLADALDEYHLYHLTRADLLRRCGRRAEAAAAYERGRELTRNQAEHDFLEARLRQISTND